MGNSKSKAKKAEAAAALAASKAADLPQAPTAKVGGVAPPLPPPPSSSSTSSSSSSSSAATAASSGGGGGGGGGEGGDVDFSQFGTTKLVMEDFEILKVLGKGAFGKVMLVKKKDDPRNTLYALKSLRKAELVKKGQIEHTTTERHVLERISSPFLVHLAFAFQTTDKLYMVLDYCTGGELFHWLKAQHRFSETRARLYTAEIILAVEAMHTAQIIHRDLKPENLLLDGAGHIKLTDFGLAKGGITGAGAEGGTKTFCGTPEYVAPEIIENKGHGKAVDWWATGAILYEMLVGLPPFYDTNVNKMYTKILHDPLRFPSSSDTSKHVSDPAKEVLRGLLERRISARLGSSSSGAAAIKATPFFSSLDFARVLRKEYTPEFRPPQMRNERDVRNFDAEFTSEIAQDSLVEGHMSETMQDKSNFEGFTYKPRGPGL